MDVKHPDIRPKITIKNTTGVARSLEDSVSAQDGAQAYHSKGISLSDYVCDDGYETLDDNPESPKMDTETPPPSTQSTPTRLRRHLQAPNSYNHTSKTLNTNLTLPASSEAFPPDPPEGLEAAKDRIVGVSSPSRVRVLQPDATFHTSAGSTPHTRTGRTPTQTRPKPHAISSHRRPPLTPTARLSQLSVPIPLPQASPSATLIPKPKPAPAPVATPFRTPNSVHLEPQSKFQSDALATPAFYRASSKENVNILYYTPPTAPKTSSKVFQTRLDTKTGQGCLGGVRTRGRTRQRETSHNLHNHSSSALPTNPRHSTASTPAAAKTNPKRPAPNHTSHSNSTPSYRPYPNNHPSDSYDPSRARSKKLGNVPSSNSKKATPCATPNSQLPVLPPTPNATPPPRTTPSTPPTPHSPSTPPSTQPKQDLGRDILIWKKGVKQGDVTAMYNLGMCMVWGWGIPLSSAEGSKWLRKAAHNGHHTAKLQLARYLASQLVNGHDLKQDHKIQLMEECRQLYFECGRMEALQDAKKQPPLIACGNGSIAKATSEISTQTMFPDPHRELRKEIERRDETIKAHQAMAEVSKVHAADFEMVARKLELRARALHEENEQLNDKLEKAASCEKALQNQIEATKAQISNLDTQNQQLRQSLNKGEVSLKAGREKLEAVFKENQRLTKVIEDRDKKASPSASLGSGLTSGLAVSQSMVTSASKELMQSKISHLEKELQQARDEASRSSKAVDDAVAKALGNAVADAVAKATADAKREASAGAQAQAQAHAQVLAQADERAQAQAQAHAEALAKANSQAEAQAKSEAEARAECVRVSGLVRKKEEELRLLRQVSVRDQGAVREMQRRLEDKDKQLKDLRQDYEKLVAKVDAGSTEAENKNRQVQQKNQEIATLLQQHKDKMNRLAKSHKEEICRMKSKMVSMQASSKADMESRVEKVELSLNDKYEQERKQRAEVINDMMEVHHRQIKHLKDHLESEKRAHRTAVKTIQSLKKRLKQPQPNPHLRQSHSDPPTTNTSNTSTSTARNPDGKANLQHKNKLSEGISAGLRHERDRRQLSTPISASREGPRVKIRELERALRAVQATSDQFKDRYERAMLMYDDAVRCRDADIEASKSVLAKQKSLNTILKQEKENLVSEVFKARAKCKGLEVLVAEARVRERKLVGRIQALKVERRTRQPPPPVQPRPNAPMKNPVSTSNEEPEPRTNHPLRVRQSVVGPTPRYSNSTWPTRASRTGYEACDGYEAGSAYGIHPTVLLERLTRAEGEKAQAVKEHREASMKSQRLRKHAEYLMRRLEQSEHLIQKLAKKIGRSSTSTTDHTSTDSDVSMRAREQKEGMSMNGVAFRGSIAGLTGEIGGGRGRGIGVIGGIDGGVGRGIDGGVGRGIDGGVVDGGVGGGIGEGVGGGIGGGTGGEGAKRRVGTPESLVEDAFMEEKGAREFEQLSHAWQHRDLS
ncbi:hypothetical protein AAMO2058_001693300 [Amorphochlora amoebiformis]